MTPPTVSFLASDLVLLLVPAGDGPGRDVGLVHRPFGQFCRIRGFAREGIWLTVGEPNRNLRSGQPHQRPHLFQAKFLILPILDQLSSQRVHQGVPLPYPSTTASRLKAKARTYNPTTGCNVAGIFVLRFLATRYPTFHDRHGRRMR